MTNDLPLSKEQILDAAEQVLRRFGPDKTSVVDVAKVLGVSHGTLYRHFASKAALREAVTERWLHRSVAAPLEDIAAIKDGSAADRLRLWMDALIAGKRKFAAEDAEMFAMYAEVTLHAVGIVASHVDKLIGQMAVIIEEGIRTGEFKSGSSIKTANAIFMATSRFHHPAHVAEWSSEQANEQFELVWGLLLSGIVSSHAN